MLRESRNLVVLAVADQADRLDYDYYRPGVLTWVRYSREHPELNWTKLGGLLDFSTVGFVGKVSDKYRDTGVRYLTNKNVRPYFLDDSDMQFVDEQFAKIIGHTALQGNEVLICRSGAPGAACVCPPGYGSVVCGDILILRPTEELRPNYLMTYINSDLGKALLCRECTGSGLEHLNLNVVRQAKIPKLSSDNQELILDRSSAIIASCRQFALSIDRLQQRNVESLRATDDAAFAVELTLESFVPAQKAKVLIRQAEDVERLDIPANHPDYTRLVDQIQQSPNAGTLGDLVELSEDRFDPAAHRGEQVHYLAIGDIDGVTGKILQPQVMPAEELPSRARRLLRKDDILVGIAGASTGTENMVVVAVDEDQSGWVGSTGFLVLRARHGVSVPYVCHLLKAPFVLRQIRALLVSPAMPTIGDADVMALSVPNTDEPTRSNTLTSLQGAADEHQATTAALDAMSARARRLLSTAKANIFDLLDNDKFTEMSAEANALRTEMAQLAGASA